MNEYILDIARVHEKQILIILFSLSARIVGCATLKLMNVVFLASSHYVNYQLTTADDKKKYAMTIAAVKIVIIVNSTFLC